MKIISWNINGYRSIERKGAFQPILNINPDVICLQEVKINSELINIDGYYSYYNFANKKGYSGVSVLTKEKPISIKRSVGDLKFDSEGRLLVLEFEEYYVINIYIPHGGRNKEHHEHKFNSINILFKLINELTGKKVIICTDFNIAHSELDVFHYKNNYNNNMFSPKERLMIDKLISLGFVDSFRINNCNNRTYSMWPNAFNCRDRNIGWRIDYIFLSGFKNFETSYLMVIKGSDHCPILMITNDTK